jgi:hypothetical protein
VRGIGGCLTGGVGEKTTGSDGRGAWEETQEVVGLFGGSPYSPKERGNKSGREKEKT